MSREQEILERLRRICLALPETTETDSWGHPNFKAGKKIFCAFEAHRGKPCIAFKAAPEEHFALTEDARFEPTPHGGKWGWLFLDATSRLRWKEVEGLVLSSYRQVALKRMLAALDD